MDFGFPERKFVPEVDEIPVNPYRLKKIIEELEEYNAMTRLWKAYDSTGQEIPEKYRGRNRYWGVVGEGQNEQYGAYTIYSVYDLDPAGRILIAKYKIVRSAAKTSAGKELEEMPLQTMAQAERHVRAARLEADRQERMAKKDPTLVAELKAHIPLMMTPEVARRRIDARLNPK